MQGFTSLSSISSKALFLESKLLFSKMLNTKIGKEKRSKNVNKILLCLLFSWATL